MIDAHASEHEEQHLHAGSLLLAVVCPFLSSVAQVPVSSIPSASGSLITCLSPFRGALTKSKSEQNEELIGSGMGSKLVSKMRSE
mgnify:FL=1